MDPVLARNANAMSGFNPLNPAAGVVPVPKDHRELKAAVQAIPTTHRLFPYVDWRYGERGRRFSQSDSAWLAWLTQHPQGHVDEQILWLRSILSNRGMPGLVLETHLRVLEKHLVRSVPEKSSTYAKLVQASRLLESQRRQTIDSERVDELVDEFASTTGQAEQTLVRGAGRLLVNAVVDERLGVENAVSSLWDWLVDAASLRRASGLRERLPRQLVSELDSETFPAAWEAAANRTIEDARRLTRG